MGQKYQEPSGRRANPGFSSSYSLLPTPLPCRHYRRGPPDLSRTVLAAVGQPLPMHVNGIAEVPDGHGEARPAAVQLSGVVPNLGGLRCHRAVMVLVADGTHSALIWAL
jgi:hypothetical protein